MSGLPAFADHGAAVTHIHGIIKAFADACPSNFEKSGIIVCEKCDSSGIPVKYQKSEITYWSAGTYCTGCGGVGYKNIDNLYGSYYVCKTCQGAGCKRCENKGIADWISHIMGGK